MSVVKESKERTVERDMGRGRQVMNECCFLLLAEWHFKAALRSFSTSKP